MKRTMTLLIVWLTGAAAAVGLGLLAVSLLANPASPSSANARFLAADSSVTAPATAAPTGVSGTQATPGGTVYASCSAGMPVLAAAPAAGWQVDDSRDHSRIEFHNGTSTVEVSADCSTGSPRFTVEGPHAGEDGGHGSGSPAAPTSGGHGADDPAGHDSGGHGADD